MTSWGGKRSLATTLRNTSVSRQATLGVGSKRLACGVGPRCGSAGQMRDKRTSASVSRGSDARYSVRPFAIARQDMRRLKGIQLLRTPYLLRSRRCARSRHLRLRAQQRHLCSQNSGPCSMEIWKRDLILHASLPCKFPRARSAPVPPDPMDQPNLKPARGTNVSTRGGHLES